MRPRLGFLGVGWIGRARMEAVLASDVADVAAVADNDPEAAELAAKLSGAPIVGADEMLGGGVALDGVVIATPSGLHAAQALEAMSCGMSVFCQKPLGRDAAECATVVELARRHDRLLGVDLSYRHLRAVEQMRLAFVTGGIGDVFSAELSFHNAYGPDKGWYRDRALAGGGCVIDLGIHLVDLALWMLSAEGPCSVEGVTARLFAAGSPVSANGRAVEDYATARLDLSTGATVQLSCSWYLHAGCDAVISATFHGTKGAVVLENVGGSFYDFRAALNTGTKSRSLAEPPDRWGGRAVVKWAEGLHLGLGFEEEAGRVVEVARVLDRIYGR